MENERESWNQRYRERSHGGLDPDPFLLSAYREFIEPLFPKRGTALDVAGGVGRHAIWLAERKWKVDLVDISEVGIAKARQNAGTQARRIGFQACDVKKFRAGEKPYDVVLVFFYLERSTFSELVKAVRPGGLLIYKTYTRVQTRFSGGPTHPMHLLKANELLRVFSDLQVLYYKETIRQRGVAEFVGRKLSHRFCTDCRGSKT